MVTSTIEIPEKKVRFSGLEELRSELRSQAKNREYLIEFEKTIDEALRENEKDGIIEFTENEWQDLITDENLPPLEQVKELLASKINAMREVTAETKEKTGGIAEEIEAKVEEVKKGVTEKVDEVKEKGQAAITEALSPLQKIKEGFGKLGTTLTDMWSNIWTPVKFAWYTLWATLGFKFGKEALAAMTKEKAEKVIKEGKEKAKEEVAEAKEGLAEKTAPLGILAGAGLGIFKLIKDRLPPSLVEKLGGIDGKELLNKLATNRALKLFGIGGFGLIGIGKLSEYIENNGASLGEMPTDEAGKKAWWKKVLEKAGIGIKEGSEEIWAILSGAKVEEYFEERGPRPGYQFLEDSELLADVKSKIKLLGDKLEFMYKNNPTAFYGALIGIGIVKPNLLIGAGLKGTEMVRVILRALYKSAKNHPILWGIELALLGSQKELVGHIQVPENMTTEDVETMLSDMADIGEIGAKLEEVTPGYKAKEHIHTVTAYLDNNGAKLSAEIENLMNNWEEKLDEGAREFLVQDAVEKIGAQDKIGLEAFQADIVVQLQKEKKGESAPELFGADGTGGVLQEIIDKTRRGESIIESDIYKMMRATEGTNIRIFPAGGETDGGSIQWVWLDEQGNSEAPAKNICINPLLEQDEKVTVSEDFYYDPSSLGFWGKLGSELYSGVIGSISEIADKVTSHPGEAKTAVERVIGAGGALGKIGGKAVITYLDQVYILGPAQLFDTLLPGGKELSGQEFLVEYAGGILPVLFVTTAKRALLGQGVTGKKGWYGMKVLLETAAYPVKVPLDIGKHLFKRWQGGNLGELLNDPLVTIRDEFYKKLGNMPINTEKMRDMGTKLEEKEKYEKMKKKIEKLQKNGSGLINNRKRIQETLDEAGKLFNKKFNTPADALREIDTQIKALDNSIALMRGTVKAELQEKIKQNPRALTEADIPAKKGDLLAAQKAVEARIADLEKAKQEALAKNKAGQMTDAEWNSAKRNFARRTTQLENFNARIRVHIDGHPTHPVEGKWKGRARGIIGVATLALVMVGVSKLRADDPGMEIPELDGIDSEVEFFGFTDGENETTETENTETESEKKNEAKVENSSEYIQPFRERMSVIQGMYGTEFEFLGNPEALMTASDEKIEQKIGEVKNIHTQMMIDMKEAVRENKEAIKKYFQEGDKKDFAIKKHNLNAFFALTEENGNISLDYMDETDFSVTIWDMVDFNRDNAENLLDGSYNQWWDAGSYMIPIYGTWRDGKSTWRNFGRGHVGQGFKSLGWTIFGGVCDAATVISLGSASPVTAGVKGVIRGVGSGLRMARMGKILSVISKIRGLSSGKIAGSLLGKGMNTALTHSGKFMLGGVGADAAHQLIEFPRSESINIDKL